jgi:esterase/lipase superfamily enzyme
MMTSEYEEFDSLLDQLMSEQGFETVAPTSCASYTQMEPSIVGSDETSWEVVSTSKHPSLGPDPMDRMAWRVEPTLLDSAKVDALYEIYYGTDRRPTTGVDGRLTGFDRRQDAGTERIYYGRCKVFIPRSHKLGSIGSGWWQRVFSEDDSLKLSSLDGYTEAAFHNEIRQHLANDSGPNQIVVFIHGYNVSFEEAALRTAQIGFDLQIRGPMAFFSWPSRGSPLGYVADGTTIEASFLRIEHFLTDIIDKTGAQTVHLIVHSMGNRATLNAIRTIAARAATAARRPFGQIILAAPDVDAGVFGTHCQGYTATSQRSTLYVNHGDLAIRLSKFVNKFARAGYAPPIHVFPGIDTVNVSQLDLDTIGHGYVAQAEPVLRDIQKLIFQDLPPETRGHLRRTLAAGDVYWDFGPDQAADRRDWALL